MNKLNALYSAWDAVPVWDEGNRQKRLGELLEAVRIRVVERFSRLVVNDDGHRGPLDSSFEDIASDTVITVWRALPGYPGTDKLKEYKDFGKFASYVATVANGVRKDSCKLRDNALVSHYDPQALEYVQAGLEPGYESEEPEDFFPSESISL